MRAKVRLATWNVNSLAMRLPRVLDWLEHVAPDVLCLQETKLADAAFPHEAFAARRYLSVAHGDGGYNGVALLSRVGLENVQRGFGGEPPAPDPQPAPASGVAEAQATAGAPSAARGSLSRVERRAIAADCAGVRVWSVYVPNGRTLDSPFLPYKLAWLDALGAAAERELKDGRRLALCGDFNVAPSDADVWDPAAFAGSTHVSPAERGAIERLLALGLTDVLPRALKGEPFTYWDYRAGMFHKGCGMRIDLALLSGELAAGLSDAWIDREARKGQKPSDHAPVVLDIDL